MLYNSKWSENFQACSQLAFPPAFPKSNNFYYNVILWSAIAQIFGRIKNGICHFKR